MPLIPYPFLNIYLHFQNQYHRIMEWKGSEGTSVGHLVQPSCRSRVTYSRLHGTSSRWGLNTSREADSTTSLGSLFQCSVTLRGKKFFLVFSWNFLCFSLCPLPLVLSLVSHPIPSRVAVAAALPWRVLRAAAQGNGPALSEMNGCGCSAAQRWPV